ncbi:MAG: peptidoglycan DD-metalloendopeptidase family protein [Bacteroidota bacterium]
MQDNYFVRNCACMLVVIFLITSCTTVSPPSAPAGSFQAQKGNLPWPAQGDIIEPYGTVVNPTYGTEAINPGILISTVSTTVVSAVHGGKVESIYVMPEYGNLITISHGEYTTVYGNLSEMYVNEGVTVEAGQYIASAGSQLEPKGEAIFFAIFQQGQEMDPALWLRKQ